MIEIKGLKKSFGEKILFEEVNLSLSKGSIYGFLGINGIGKSVFLRLLAVY
ncbi:ATP-binding cassette domain-containing protein [Proteinivorax tanatarense]|uniref:ATP-binding cassette domain-containing protein n=1 Tax=Proteinivorax tanatarense TaxID=1260629 RepID=A0AAU7VL21_9FIRM